eukprot:CAMPEP_0201219246 /NCGR_PEP_ID=MMETSP0851-20130426/190982_1 /ASSEMBLY_ACC=CAM_ASM_000631 /TAXON_ID=183588 /ORGANISM="Pseudo-nitzschia fraudulenta, Strain WWA7" /LENGTH=412 /DNA_ID=CAMNT_0047508935 /DNA_START=134 /DNA_END=1369 /DNA_ORIENTATION=+
MPRRNPRRNPTDDDPGDDDPTSREDDGNAPGGAAPDNPPAIGAVLRAVLDPLVSLEERLDGPRREIVDQEDADVEDGEGDENVTVEAMPTPSISGYKRDRSLNKHEWEFYQQMKTLGITDATVNELFRQGYTSNESFADFTDENMKTMVLAIGKNKSLACPDPTKVFLLSTFTTKLCVLVSWIAFQKQICGDPSPRGWLDDANSNTPYFYKDTKARLLFYKQAKLSREATKDTKLPPSPKNMKKFREFDKHLQNYLRSKFGAADVPLSYVIRQTAEVTQEDRNKRVGSHYEDWNHYCITCTLLEGPHWGSDNNSTWQIISNLVRDGSGWDFIRKFECQGGGDGCSAYAALYTQAYQHTHVRTLWMEAEEGLRNLRYNGPSQNFTWDQYVGKWYRYMNDLNRLGKGHPESSYI